MNITYHTRKIESCALEETVILTKETCKLLLPLLKNAHKKVMAKYIHYKDIHEGGYSTVREEDLLSKYEQQLEVLENTLTQINSLLN